MPASLGLGCLEVDLAAGRIFKYRTRLHLRGQPFQVLGDLPERPRLIETLPKRGYRFLTPLSTPRSVAAAGAGLAGQSEFWCCSP